MLRALKIRNIAVIDEAEIQFGTGLNILSGETGAGKSIIIAAISLILGCRADTNLIRTGCDEASVEGFFDIEKLKWLKRRLEENGFEPAEELLIRRTVHKSGKHKIHINGQMATLSMLADLTEGLVDLCSQHEHQSLLKPSTQLELLDLFGESRELADQFGENFRKRQTLKHELDELKHRENEFRQKAEFIRFQLAELEGARLRSGEDEELQEEKKLLQSSQGRMQLAQTVLDAMEAESGGAIGGLQITVAKLRSLVQLDEKLRPELESVERALIECEDATRSLSRYAQSVDHSPERLEQIQERLALFADFRRKYGTTIEDMLQTQARLTGEIQEFETMDEKSGDLEKNLRTLEDQLSAQASRLTLARGKAAKKLSDKVSLELQELKMEGARFLVELNTQKDPEQWNASGADEAGFVIQVNRGEAPKALGKVASGGELSRLMLAIRRVISDRGGIGVYLFDEIDAGIGGQTAFQVGRKLKSVSDDNQVICITHLAQVAAFADHHFSVQKTIKSSRTITRVEPLTRTNRVEEVARMLGGAELTKKTLDNAKELIEKAGAPAQS